MWKRTSIYLDNLEKDDQTRYLDKLADPYNISEAWESNVLKLPDITWPDIYNYLIDNPSDFIRDKLRAYKSLDAYIFFCSWPCSRCLLFRHKTERHVFHQKLCATKSKTRTNSESLQYLGCTPFNGLDFMWKIALAWRGMDKNFTYFTLFIEVFNMLSFNSLMTEVPIV